ncbi:MAG: hypothetical protein JO048_10945 [Methylobacteriaceae bacterium]|nr:hypothetical protein [Methylobacteriaceae bacterium]
MRRGAREGSGSATSAVLWLMLLLVFLPIALAHVAARFGAREAEPGTDHAAPAAPAASSGAVPG